MNKHQYLLLKLSEECVEVSKEAHKAICFGIESSNPFINEGDNRQKIIEELNDLLGVASMLVDAGVLPLNWQSNDLQTLKKNKVIQYSKVSKEKGELSEDII